MAYRRSFLFGYALIGVRVEYVATDFLSTRKVPADIFSDFNVYAFGSLTVPCKYVDILSVVDEGHMLLCIGRTASPERKGNSRGTQFWMQMKIAYSQWESLKVCERVFKI